MKSFIIALVIAPLLSFSVYQNTPGITAALRSGNADQLGQYFDAKVELSLMDSEGVYDKTQAVAKVKAFFSSHRPSAFAEVHSGASKGSDGKYMIGDLTTGSDDVYRVYFYLSKVNSKYLIQELRIDEE